ncbi:hypothetical protein LSH36_1204g00011 [Paralvinella palmiformis]|uniref:Uncharacterized protein n=1 Tax=Paralvinella palmiformis TaxID=53620 RepID=A0AAD9IV56_9ANNE|nr:hypothetical protein LSH36_1204g00011 [Paralvinella palmiformis]
MYLLPAIALFLAAGCVAAEDVDCNEITMGDCALISLGDCSEPCGGGWQKTTFDCRNGSHGKGTYACTSPCNIQDCDTSCDTVRYNKNCRRLQIGACSKTCGVGSYNTIYKCYGDTLNCQEACCCRPCGPGKPGGGRPGLPGIPSGPPGGGPGGPGTPAISCRDASDIPKLDIRVVCPPRITGVIL